jgi:hypothetical protein
MTIAALALAIAPSSVGGRLFRAVLRRNFGGEVGRPLSETVDERNRFAWGFGVGGWPAASLALSSTSVTHNFYASNGAVVTKNNLITAMPALVIGIPIGGQQAPVSAHACSAARAVEARSRLRYPDSVSRKRLQYELGGGVMGYFTDHVGLRGDLRYFRNFQVDDIDLTGVDFERARSTSDGHRSACCSASSSFSAAPAHRLLAFSLPKARGRSGLRQPVLEFKNGLWADSSIRAALAGSCRAGGNAWARRRASSCRQRLPGAAATPIRPPFFRPTAPCSRWQKAPPSSASGNDLQSNWVMLSAGAAA